MAVYVVCERNSEGAYEKTGEYDNWFAVIDDCLKYNVFLEDMYKAVLADEGCEQYPLNKIFNMSDAEYYFDQYCQLVNRKLTETGKFEMPDKSFRIEVMDECHKIIVRAEMVEVVSPEELKIFYPCEVYLSAANSIKEPTYVLGHNSPDDLSRFSFYGEVYLTASQWKEYTANHMTNGDMFEEIFNSKSSYPFIVVFSKERLKK